MNRWFPVAAIMLVASACSDTGFDTRPQELAHPGGWDPPEELIALADTYDIENVQAGPWIGEEGCGGQFLEGTRVLRDWVYEHWPQTDYIGGYSCRPIANSSSMSVHATGRALDIMLPTDDSEPRDDSADNDLGDPLANWLLEHAEEIGIQLIIWDNMIWSSSRAPGERFRVYTNEHKHHDHIHMELNPEAADRLTPWFMGEMGPPDLGPCGDPIPADGGIVDDDDECFTAYGPAEFWRVEEGEGHDGTLRWTNAFESENPSNWARWRLSFEEAGRYRVDYHSVAEWAVFDSTRYRVRADGKEEDVFVDLSAGENGWQPLAEYDFAQGRDQWVSIYDNTPASVPSDQHIIADAIRLVRVDGASMEEEQDPPDGMGGPDVDEDPGGKEPTIPADEEDPDVVEGKGGCGCATADQSADGTLPLLLLFGMGWLRRRRDP